MFVAHNGSILFSDLIKTATENSTFKKDDLLFNDLLYEKTTNNDLIEKANLDQHLQKKKNRLNNRLTYEIFNDWQLDQDLNISIIILSLHRANSYKTHFVSNNTKIFFETDEASYSNPFFWVEKIQRDDWNTLVFNIFNDLNLNQSKSAEYRFLSSQGVKWYKSTFKKFNINSKTFIKILSEDVSKEMDNLRSLREAKKINSFFIQTVPHFVYLYDPSENKYTILNNFQTISKTPNQSNIHTYYQNELNSYLSVEEIGQLHSYRESLFSKQKTSELSIKLKITISQEETKLFRVTEKLITENDKSILLGIAEDITNDQQIITKLEKETLFDYLTNLPNRQYLIKKINEKLKDFHDGRINSIALFFMDIDRFKIINDSLGYKVGDELLLAISRRILSILPENTYFARLGGDEFGIVLLNYSCLEELSSLAKNILKEMEKPFDLNYLSVYVSSSIGVATADKNSQQAESLLGDADTAMFKSKRKGRGSYEFFTSQMHKISFTTLQLESDIRTAIQNSEFIVYYQPIFSLVTNQIEKCEALVRWLSPSRGFVSPGTFIPVLEDIGLIRTLDEWVMNQSCKQAYFWQENGIKNYGVSVNLSSQNFLDDSIIDYVQKTLETTKLDPNLLTIELTESTIMNDLYRSQQKIQQLRNLGITIAIDDFGTGYSSLAYLKELNIDTLKIDASFIEDLINDTHSQAIVKSIISLGRSLGIKVIAEGVETLDHVRLLRDYQCDEIQGYLISKPIDNAKLIKFFNNSTFIPNDNLLTTLQEDKNEIY